MSSPPDHLSYDEVAQVLALAQDADAVLVGGQSLAIWSRHYVGRRPEIARVYSMSSEDVDFLGDRAAAEKFASKLASAKIYLPGPDDHTPHSAVVVGMVANRRIRIDFLHSILGTDRKSVKNNVVTLSGSHAKTGKSIDIVVLHPLDCLRSRLSNINDLGRKDPHSIHSARASILVIDAFIDELLQGGVTKEAQSTLRDLPFIIRSAYLGKAAQQEIGMDPRDVLRRYVDDKRLDERFRKFNLANALDRLNRREAALKAKD